MIDFRYHIVSLISVFLALAVGIALGAGPLQGSIGDQLTGQVEQLRAEKDELRIALDAETTRTRQQNAFIEASSDELLADSLPRSVAVVVLPGAEDAVVDAATQRLEQAGATIASRVAVTSAWTDPAQRAFRSSLVGNLAAYLDPAPAADASAEEILGAALGQALTTASAEDPARPSENASLVLEVLTSGELVTTGDGTLSPADAVVVIAAPTVAADATPAPTEESVGALLDLVTALASESQGVVVGGAAADDTDLVAAVRAGDARERVATVDGVDAVTGQINLPRALAAAIAGTVGHFGFAGSAESALPPAVDLQPVPAPAPQPETAPAE